MHPQGDWTVSVWRFWDAGFGPCPAVVRLLRVTGNRSPSAGKERAIVDSVMFLWTRRPISVRIRASVHAWSGQPCAAGPLAAPARAPRKASLCLGLDAAPFDSG